MFHDFFAVRRDIAHMDPHPKLSYHRQIMQFQQPVMRGKSLDFGEMSQLASSVRRLTGPVSTFAEVSLSNNVHDYKLGSKECYRNATSIMISVRSAALMNGIDLPSEQ